MIMKTMISMLSQKTILMNIIMLMQFIAISNLDKICRGYILLQNTVEVLEIFFFTQESYFFCRKVKLFAKRIKTGNLYCIDDELTFTRK